MKMEFHSINCACCQQEFTALSSKARYCSNACRCTAYRQRKRHATREPIPGLSGKAAIMYTDIANASAPIANMIASLAAKRGKSAARDAIYIAVAALWPGVLDPSLSMHDYYNSELPDYLKESAA